MIELSNMQIKIQTFGIAREICGDAQISMLVPESTTAGQLKQLLTEQYPRLGALASFLLAVNEEYAEPHIQLQANDEIAVIPPVSGG